LFNNRIGLILIRLFRFDLRLKSNPNGTQKNRKLRIPADFVQ